MREVEGEEHLDKVRERLYMRTEEPTAPQRSGFSGRPQMPASGATQRVPPRPPFTPPTSFMAPHKRKKFRTTLVFGGAIFFALALVLSGSLLLFGNNSISGSNISIDVRGPFAVGGGEELPLTIAITNQNSIPIEAATLIIEYPSGTQSAEDKGKELFRERRALSKIKPGEVLNITTNALVFGEENDEKEVRVSVEYRIEGSNATFYKDASPLRFKISSSPVTLSVEAVKQITSGQEMDFEIKVKSNSPTELTDLVLNAEYPYGFDFTRSSPNTSSGENVWFIDALKPEEEKTITVRGLMTGQTTDVRVFNFTVGVAGEQDRYSLASVFTTKTHEVSIERAFVELALKVNGESTENPAIGTKDAATVDITFTNTLSDTIHDAEIEVLLGGNALAKNSVSAGNGYYDSSKSTITWDGNDSPNLREIAPGRSSTVTFTVTPSVTGGSSRTPQVTISVNVKGKRVREDSVSEKLTGTVSRTIKVESVTSLTSQVLYSVGPFKNSGPTPPVAEEVTQYTIVLAATNGSNSVTDTVVEATLPPYVTWLDLKTANEGTFSYNPSTRVVTWNIGNLDADEPAEGSFQVSFLPSVSQVGTIPALVTGQRLRATDRFTGTVIRSSAPDLNTRLDLDPDSSVRDGRVKAN